jgi:hypothetical protein
MNGAAGRPPLVWLALVISADNLSGGIASTAFVAYLSSLTHRSYTATQYALFSSLMTLPGKFLSGFSGLGRRYLGVCGVFRDTVSREECGDVANRLTGHSVLFVAYRRPRSRQCKGSCPTSDNVPAPRGRHYPESPLHPQVARAVGPHPASRLAVNCVHPH